MMNKYIKSIINNRNEFRVNTRFVIFDTLIESDELKIDTGCGYTMFPLKRIATFSVVDILNFKKQIS